MKKQQNQFERKQHPFHQFEGTETLQVQWDGTDPERAQRTKERLPQTLQEWNTVLLLAGQFAQLACKRTGLAFDGHSPETELRQIWPAGEWRKMELLLDALGKENITLTGQEMEDCRQAALQLSIKARRSWTFRDSIVQILRTNFELEKEVFTLKAQVTALEKMQDASLTDPETLVLPGKILQNDVNVNWSCLREQFGIILDEPPGNYLYAVNRLLETPARIINQEMLYGELIGHSRETLAARYELDEYSLLYIEQELYRRGLCFGLDPEKLLARFYYCYFANTPLASLPVSTRVFNALAGQKITTIGDLLLRDEESLLRIPFMGKTSLVELDMLLKAMGFKFNMQEQNFRRLYCF